MIADGKRGDVPVSAAAYAQALFGSTPTPWGEVGGLGADAATVNPLLGGDSLEPLLDGAAEADAGLFVLVRTSNPGAADLLDLPAPDAPLFERLAALVAERADRLMGECGLSGVGAVVGATEPRHLVAPARADAALDLPGPRGGRAGRPRRRPRAGLRRASGLGPGDRVALDRGRAGSRGGRRASCGPSSGRSLATDRRLPSPGLGGGAAEPTRRWSHNPPRRGRARIRSRGSSPSWRSWPRRSWSWSWSRARPAGPVTGPSRARAARRQSQAQRESYCVVRAGDTFAAIAVEARVPETRLAELNPNLDQFSSSPRIA